MQVQPRVAQARPDYNVETPNTAPFIQEMLKRTDEKRDERYKQRVNDYNKRNFAVRPCGNQHLRSLWQSTSQIGCSSEVEKARSTLHVNHVEAFCDAASVPKVLRQQVHSMQDYFRYESGASQKRGISEETAKKINKWLENNK